MKLARNVMILGLTMAGILLVAMSGSFLFLGFAHNEGLNAIIVAFFFVLCGVFSLHTAWLLKRGDMGRFSEKLAGIVVTILWATYVVVSQPYLEEFRVSRQWTPLMLSVFLPGIAAFLSLRVLTQLLRKEIRDRGTGGPSK